MSLIEICWRCAQAYCLDCEPCSMSECAARPGQLECSDCQDTCEECQVGMLAEMLDLEEDIEWS